MVFLHTTSCSWKIRNCSSQSFRFIAVANFLLFLIGYGPSTSKLVSYIKGTVSCFKPLCQVLNTRTGFWLPVQHYIWSRQFLSVCASMDKFQLPVMGIFRNLCLVCFQVTLFEKKNLCRGLLSTGSGKQGLPGCQGTSGSAWVTAWVGNQGIPGWLL